MHSTLNKVQQEKRQISRHVIESHFDIEGSIKPGKKHNLLRDKFKMLK